MSIVKTQPLPRGSNMIAVVYHSEEWMNYVASGWITHTVGPIVGDRQIALMLYTGEVIN